jgi:hypothetical protein
MLLLPVLCVLAGLMALAGPATAAVHAVGPDFNGDGAADLAIGVPRATVGGVNDAGAVNVLYGTSPNGTQSNAPDDQRWTQRSGGIDGDPETGDQFGAAVSTGDFNDDGFTDLAIGVPTDDIKIADGAGRVNVLYGSASGLTADGNQLWSEQLQGVGGEPRSGENFGGSLSSGDYNGDGFADLAIGSPGEVLGDATGAGAVFVFYGSVDGLQVTAPVKQTWSQDVLGDDAMAGDAFGSAVASGDLNGDGFADVAVGAPGEKVESVDGAGSAHVLYGSADGLQAAGAQLWTQDSANVEGKCETGDAFGSALAIGDFNHDGRADLSVGAPGEDLEPVVDAGVVNVLYGSAAGVQTTAPKDQKWSQDSTSVKGTAETDDAFGAALTAGDFDDNGVGDLAIGAPGETIGSTVGAGVVNVLYGTSAAGLQATGPNDDKWSQNSKNLEDTAETGDAFGAALASGDYDGDGHDDLAIGVPGENVQGNEGAGAVNLLYGKADGLQVTSPADQLWHAGQPGVRGQPESGDGFGSAL